MIFPAIVLALTIVSPRPGETVPTLKEAQKAYLSGSRAERHLRLGNAADRAKLLSVGCRQRPLRVAWNGAEGAVRVQVVVEGLVLAELSVTNRNELWVTNLELDRRYQVRLTDARGDSAAVDFRTAAIPPRLLTAGGVANFRDLGGWSTADGRRVRQNLIFRSAGLRANSKSEGGFLRRRTTPGAQLVTDAGLETLKTEFGIRTDLELRAPQEISGMETTLLGPQAKWRAIALAAYDAIEDSETGREPFARIFKLLVRRESYPVLFHDADGRDRAGTLAFLLNGLLGVPEDDLLRDWEMSFFAGKSVGLSLAGIERLQACLARFKGETLQDRIEAYVSSCGVCEDEISAFRQIMLEGEPR